MSPLSMPTPTLPEAYVLTLRLAQSYTRSLPQRGHVREQGGLSAKGGDEGGVQRNGQQCVPPQVPRRLEASRYDRYFPVQSQRQDSGSR